ncbi:hypothetical protein F8538_09775 [Edwardsiella ictaluri]|nr:hypothetical protein F8538_09775 [Edwardsiella ictaluri]
MNKAPLMIDYFLYSFGEEFWGSFGEEFWGSFGEVLGKDAQIKKPT